MTFRILTVLLCLLSAVAFADVAPAWHAGFGPPPDGLGLDGDPRALHVHVDGALYVGGSFSQAGPTTAWFVARLDEVAGTYAWTSLGDLDDRVDAIVSWGDSVLIGGRFTDAGGVTVNRVSVWDGAAWSPVGDPAAWSWGHVLALTLHDGAPWAAGSGFVARWTGSTWETVTGSFSGDVFALASYGGALYAGGAFSSIDGPDLSTVSADNVAAWDSVWANVGGGLDGTCYALEAWSGKLVAGGVFSSPHALLAAWDGGLWSSPGGTLYGNYVTAVDAMGARLFAGGDLAEAGGTPVANVAQLVNGAWWALGEGVDGMVRALANDGETVFAGGSFLNAGGAPSAHLGAWLDPTVDAPPPSVAKVGAPFPNPFNPHVSLPFRLDESARVRAAVHDLDGRRLRNLIDADLPAGGHVVAWDGRDHAGRALPSAVYVLNLHIVGATVQRRVLLLK